MLKHRMRAEKTKNCPATGGKTGAPGVGADEGRLSTYFPHLFFAIFLILFFVGK